MGRESLRQSRRSGLGEESRLAQDGICTASGITEDTEAGNLHSPPASCQLSWAWSPGGVREMETVLGRV